MKYPYILYMWWYHRPSTPTGPLPKNGHRHFKFTLSHSMDKKSHHTKFYQNRLKNMEVMTMFLPPQIRGKFVRKYEILKFGGIQFFGKCVLSNHSISNHFAGSISKQHLRTTLISTNIQPFCGKYRQIIQPFHLISTSKDILPFCFIQPVFRDIQPFGTIQTHIQPLLVYPTAFSKYPTVLIE